MTDLAAGKRLRSNVSDTEIIVVRAPATPLELSCGGQPMIADPVSAGTAPTNIGDNDTALGKRYVDTDTGLEVLCTKPGPGVLTADGRVLTIKAPSALPASD
jgi:hypothetical protein